MRIYLKQVGFSLLELILVIVLLGVLATGAGLLITAPIQAYSDQVRRTHLVDQAEMSLRQIARDIRRALPNSIRITQKAATKDWALEMVNTVAGARYRDEAGGAFNSEFDILDFSEADAEFNFLGTLRPGVTSIPSGQRLVIYNTAPTNFYQDASANSNPGIVTPATSVLTLSTRDAGTVSISDDEQRLNINPTFQFFQQSPGQRAFLVDGPISYVCDLSGTNTRIDRYAGYAYQDPQIVTNAALAGLTGVLAGAVATRVTACSISYQAGTTQRSGTITLGITVSDAGESVSLLHQVHVVNVP